VADEPDLPEEEEEEDLDQPGEEGILQILGLDSRSFAGKVAASVQHAALRERADAGKLPWVPMGPRNVVGRVCALALDPVDPATIYAGTAFSGVWKSVDGAETWESLGDFRPPDPPNQAQWALPVGAIAIAPSDPKVIYVGTGEPIPNHFGGHGLYRSRDGGVTFLRIAPAEVPTPPDFYAPRFERITVDPWDPDRCWIASPNGLWRLEGKEGFIPDLGVSDITDVVIDFGALPSQPPPATFMVYAAMRSGGIFRAVFDRALAEYTTPWKSLITKALPKTFRRIKLALGPALPRVVYAIFELPQPTPKGAIRIESFTSRVYVSEDQGGTWKATQARGDETRDTQPWANLVLEAHPEDPKVILAGSVDLFLTRDGGESWRKVIDWTRYDQGDRSQHADQHAVAFDPHNPDRVWVANDGGVVLSEDAGRHWRRRDFGISAAQLYGLAVHPRHPFIQGGGFQDRGTWVSFGGPSWFYMLGGDGGAMAFEPGSVQRFLATWQGPMGRPKIDSRKGLERLTVEARSAPQGGFDTPLPDLPSPGPGTRPTLRVSSEPLVADFLPADITPFVGVLAHHPTRNDHALAGRKNRAYATTDGTTFKQLHTGDLSVKKAGATVPVQVTAITYAPADPDNVWWLGTSGGGVLVTRNGSQLEVAGAQESWTAVKGPWEKIPGLCVTSIAVHPGNPSIVAVTTGPSPGKVFLSGDAGANWSDISGNNPFDALGPSPVTCSTFDPRSPDGQTLYVGTLAGVYVVRNAGAPSPEWRTFNDHLPLVLVTDLETVALEWNAAGVPARFALRCATFGRGVFECDLDGAPAVRLHIRGTPIDDGRRYPPSAALAADPRFPVPLDPLRAFDIRVDAPPYSFFGARIDGVEFDEELVSDPPVPGVPNLVYVQVHNQGSQTAAGVEIHLFMAEVPGEPPVIPDLPASFWSFLAGSGSAGPLQLPLPWLPLDTKTVTVAPGQPVVAGFAWTPPADVRGAMALLAVCSHPDDPIGGLLPGVPLPLAVGDLVRQERRTAVRVVDFPPAVYIRDGVDDDGHVGSVSWGGRSPDIIVVQAPAPDPGTSFRDLSDPRSGDQVRYGVQNHIYVRVHNRTLSPVNAEVRLYRVPGNVLDPAAVWPVLDIEDVVNIPPLGWGLTPAMTWNPGPGPVASTAPPEACLLLAIARRQGDPPPRLENPQTFAGFWRLVGDRDSQLARFNSIALRGLLIVP